MDRELPRNAETMFPCACAVCGGDVHIRVLDGHATSYCGGCHWIAHPKLDVQQNGLKVSFATQASA